MNELEPHWDEEEDATDVTASPAQKEVVNYCPECGWMVKLCQCRAPHELD